MGMSKHSDDSSVASTFWTIRNLWPQMLVLVLVLTTGGCVGSDDHGPSPVTDTPRVTTRTQTPTATPIYEQSIDQTPELPYRRIELGSNISHLNVTEVELGVYSGINSVREDENQLHSDVRLQRIARRHSYSMVTRDFYSHVDPLIGGYTTRMRNLGYDCPNMYGETLHDVPYNVTLEMYGDRYDLSTESEISRFVVDGWMNSSRHRAEVLQEEYDVVGVGIFVSEDDHILVTAEFCG